MRSERHGVVRCRAHERLHGDVHRLPCGVCCVGDSLHVHADVFPAGQVGDGFGQCGFQVCRADFFQ